MLPSLGTLLPRNRTSNFLSTARTYEHFPFDELIWPRTDSTSARTSSRLLHCRSLLRSALSCVVLQAFRQLIMAIVLQGNAFLQLMQYMPRSGFGTRHGRRSESARARDGCRDRAARGVHITPQGHARHTGRNCTRAAPRPQSCIARARQRPCTSNLFSSCVRGRRIGGSAQY